MRDITIKITGRQEYDGQEVNQMEFVTDGKAYRRRDDVYMVYEESEISGMSGCRTTIRLHGDTLRLRRIGEEGYTSELYFEKDRRFSSLYTTPFGRMEVEVLTRLVDNRIDPETLRGDVSVHYDISLQGMAEATTRLEINVM